MPVLSMGVMRLGCGSFPFPSATIIARLGEGLFLPAGAQAEVTWCPATAGLADGEHRRNDRGRLKPLLSPTS